MNTRSATWTPPSPEPRIAPATRNTTTPGVVPGIDSAGAPRELEHRRAGAGRVYEQNGGCGKEGEQDRLDEDQRLRRGDPGRGEQQDGEDRAHVPDRDTSAGERAARSGGRDRRERRVVV